MEYAFFHWGLHPWSMYAVIGLAIGYFAYRKGAGNLVSGAFGPLLGKRATEGPGKAIDVIAIFATLFGSATSLGLGALQITGGLDDVFGTGESNWVTVARDRRPDRLLRRVGGDRRREGRAVPLQRQRHRGPAAGLLPLRGRADGVHHEHLHRVAGRLPHAPAGHVVPHRGVRRRRLHQRLDDLLLGLVGVVDAVRRHVHRPHLQGPHDPPVRGLRDRGAEPGVVRLVLDHGRVGVRRAAQPGRATWERCWPRRGPRAPCSPCSASIPSPRSPWSSRCS